MTCPDTERLLEVVLGETVDPAVQAHLKECRECADTAELVREMRAAYGPELRVPEELVEGRVELITRQLSRRSSERVESSRWDAATSGALALVTVVLTILATGSFVGEELWRPGLMGGIAAVAAASYERGVRHRLTRAA
jgi:predicted anti-sigma-YlaC factor YlaD